VTLLRVLIGPPGVGKSTWCAAPAVAPRLGLVLSLDAARARLGAGEHDQSVTPAAVADVRRRCARSLVMGTSVTVDATGSSISDRATWLELAGWCGVAATAVVFRAPLALTLRRNAGRARQVPQEVVAAMAARIARTSAAHLLAEGFHAVVELTASSTPSDHP